MLIRTSPSFVSGEFVWPPLPSENAAEAMVISSSCVLFTLYLSLSLPPLGLPPPVSNVSLKLVKI